MKLVTLLQAGALLILAVFGAYASAHQTAQSCTTTSDLSQRCDL